MRRFHGIVLAASAALMIASSHAADAQLKVAASGPRKVTLSNNVGKNQFLWTSDAPLEKIKGTAEDVSGSFTVDPKNIAGLRGTISAAASSMKTGNTTRDGHLQSAAWLDVARFSQITFEVASVSNVKVNGNTATALASGTFKMHGVSKQMSIPFKITWLDESAKTRQRAPGDLVMVTADFTLALKDFNVAGTKDVIGNKVGETIAITAQLFGSTK